MSFVEEKTSDGSVTVTEMGVLASNGHHQTIPINDLNILTGVLHEYCFAALDPLARDLSVVLGAVKCADRSVLRRHGTGWQRRLRLELPVYELKVWRRPEVISSLTQALQYLTADDWQIDFVKRRRNPPAAGQMQLVNSPNMQRVFVPFSRGLDSYAQTELMKANGKHIEVVPVRVTSSKTERTMNALGRASRIEMTPVPVATSVKEPKHAEQSFRSRAFLFNVLAAYGAVISGSDEVVVPENGQGSIGGSFVRLGNEAPHRSCHPRFTSRLKRFMEALTGKEVRFLHPALYQTKGQVLHDLHAIRKDSDTWIREHRSCSYDARNASRGGIRVHCGVCGNCLLRRMSLFAAGILDVTTYKVTDLHAESLKAGLAKDDVLRNERVYQDVANNAARSMQQLADQANRPHSGRMLAEIEGLARYQERSDRDVRKNLGELLNRHSHEWAQFLAFCGERSWVAQLARG